MTATKGTTWSFEDGVPRPVGGGARIGLHLVVRADRPLEPSARHLLDEVDEVVIGRGDPAAERSAGPPRRLALRIDDNWMSADHARITNMSGRWVVEDSGSRNGTRVNGIVRVRAVLVDGDLIELGGTFLILRTDGAGDRLPADAQAADLAAPAAGLSTWRPRLRERFEALQKVAPSAAPVLIRGETGTGKELLARAVHAMSGRTGDLVAVNCAALPVNLIESELFGHRRGAFSGALEDRPGLIRSAAGGTLFLDEIGDLPAAAQGALLRALQEREVMPVGETRAIKVDFRLVAASNRDLDHLAARGEFRRDLLGRISGFAVDLPPLRDRREDLGLVIADLLARLRGERAGTVGFTREAMRALLLHDWPLNVRELERCLETGLALAGDGAVDVGHLGVAPRPDAAEDPPPTPADDARRAQLEALLGEHGGNISAVARAMGKARLQIQRWIKRYGLDPNTYKRG